MSDEMRELKRWVEHFDFINEERWGDDDKAPPSWEEVRDKHLAHWRHKDMTFDFWSAYVTGMIIGYARDVSRDAPITEGEK